MVFNWGRGGSNAASSAAGPQERAVIADAAGVGSLDCYSDIGSATDLAASSAHGGGSSSQLTGLAAAMGGDDMSWAPLPAGGAAKATAPKEPQPYRFQSHSVKAHLKDRSTAVVDLRVVVPDAPCDVLFDLLADPHQHERIFEAIESANATLVSESGPVRRWRLDYRARWKFWKVSGVCENRLWMTTDRETGTVSFVLREPGFLRKYEGTWTITGPSGKGPGGAYKAPAAAASTPSASASTSGAPSLPFFQQQRQPRRTPSSGSLSSASASGQDSPAAASSPRSLPSSSSSASASTTPADTPRSSASGGGGSSGNSGGGGGFGGFLASINNPFMPPATSHHHGPAGSGADATAQQQQQRPLQPVSPTTIMVSKCMSPKVAPPFPINQVLKGHAVGQVGDMLQGLLLATAKRLEEEGQQGQGEGAAAAQRRPQ
ncbi:hypothetical protein HYH02_014013 [Chlamydomonas schloesseri]|uniref:Coenzyme Q-binding protein COQ10 START domain-containing protein n=1 Tax=Chlamydomonas schloesseri TaxID=2026947 RepID=A0A835SZJ1_9CHLO|nr:hypothetical protein HYH02_014013 [Chlamydomonas schloesseri]|eukprot:KAG2429675.1 hypothetical protein HYH02_014013 [Chlamydomonas schloesseri]